MKKRSGFWMMIAWVLAFAACSSDKDDDSVAGKVAGTYTGTITVAQEDGTALGQPMENQKINIVKTGDNTVNLELKNFMFGEISVGDLNISGVQVSDDGKVSGSASQVPIMGGAMKADLQLSGTLKDNEADLLIIVNAPLVPGQPAVKMNVTFVGSK